MTESVSCRSLFSFKFSPFCRQCTCLLSKRWINLWTFVDSFNFSRTDFVKPESSLAFVDYALAHCVSSKLINLEMELSDSDIDLRDHPRHFERGMLIRRCLKFAAKKKVENVVIWSNDGPCCPMPKSFLTCSSLKNLAFLGIDMYFEGIKWKSLKSIKLELIVLGDTDIMSLLNGCPALESMELSRVEGFHRLEINSFNLKTLHFAGYSSRYHTDESLEIFAPYLQHLEISGNLYDLKCRLLDVSSVVNAKLTFNITCIKDVLARKGEEFDDEEDSCHDYHQALGILARDNLQKLSNATELVIGTWFADAVCMLQLKGAPVPELRCKYLTLELHLQRFNLYGAAGLLRASPHVETLNIVLKTMPSHKSHCRFGKRYLAKGIMLICRVGFPTLSFQTSRKLLLSSSPSRSA